MKILLAENDSSLQQELKKYFEKMDFEVILCNDGEEALDIISTKKVSLAVIDTDLETLDGISICQKARKLKLAKYLYIIILSSKEKKDELIKAYEAGADYYITKPLHKDEFSAHLRVGIRIIRLEDNLRNSQKKLIKLAKEDPITGLFNRRSLFDEILKELNRARRERSEFGVMRIDVDELKNIEGKYGPLAFDALLGEFSRQLKRSFREYDKLGVYGNGEFLIFLPNTNKEGAIKVAGRIRSLVKTEPISFNDKKIALSVNIGICSYNFIRSIEQQGNERLLDDLINKANLAISSAKKQGKNHVVSYDGE
jgi:two-component system, cell cycle response regulator